jgi:prolyl oligopeptidase
MGRIIAATIDGAVADLVPESVDRLVDAVVARDQLAAVYLHNATSDLRLFDRDGSPRGSVALAGPGTITTIDADSHGDDVVFAYASFTQPSTAYLLPTKAGSHAVPIGTPSTPSTLGTPSTPRTLSTS